MKELKVFETMKELDQAVEALKSKNIRCEIEYLTLFVHVSDFIRARDIILELQNSN